ncbi:TIGR02678 family protein [Paramaledivibacter caminithermalis]|jgi:uncharacterized protein (TIGR02678 family)|uniref:TIGR02678 family protein n=1 Tax=Paramaledivibacter caminithermalis (strain DSM 15212 / CIP 107654 / DViRD3) TaxID=1121301 RepID=A0A1M6T7H6_PARC5|nr:TIGR02678 family protein [Paramaledivibacter caminithermalis]SHK52913.1 TIGR02678 family protein [Paramaledivibacter caminithermalis DSM 15212]
MKELDILLENYWIIKDEDKELFYRIRDSIKELRPFITDKLGYQAIITPQLIKLEKIPGKPEDWMGIEVFEDRMEYSFLCLLLMFLEDKGREEQFLLSELTEYIEGIFPGDDKVDWTLYRHRRYLVKILRFALDIGMINLNDGDEQSFTNSRDTEVLYENTGVSKYFVRNFTGNILLYNSLEDLENDEWTDIDKDKGRIRRNRVYRRLIMAPAVYSEGADDPDYLYIKNYRNMIQNDIEKYLESDLHVHKNGAFLILNDNKNYKKSFPENKTISDIALQMNSIIIEKVKDGSLSKMENDVIKISIHSFEKLVMELKNKYSLGWSKEYREMRLNKLCGEIIKYMKNCCFIELDGINELKIMPLAGKIIGKYPKDFNSSSEGRENK